MNTVSTPPQNSRPTFLFTDIVDSSPMSLVFGTNAYREKLQGPHDVVLHNAVAEYGGYEDGTTGDSFLFAFERAEDALRAAHKMQKDLRENPITATDASGKTWQMAVRIGIHTAVQEITYHPQEGYRSLPDVNLASRVMGQARGGQVYVSEETRRVASNAAACRWHVWTYCVLKGQSPDVQPLYEPLWEGKKTKGEPKERRLPPHSASRKTVMLLARNWKGASSRIWSGCRRQTNRFTL